MKKIILLISLSLTLACQKEDELGGKLKKMHKVDKKIKACLKTLKLNGDKYCSFSENFPVVSDLKDCRARIAKLDFKVIDAEKSKLENKEFYYSTKKALIDYDKKFVYFKETTKLADCAHELIHLYQYHSKNSSSLSERRKLNKEIRKLLNAEVDELAKLEEAGEMDQVMNRSREIQSKINQVQSFNEHVEGLDEIEAYLYVYRHCNKLNCTNIDQQIALSNLYKRASFLKSDQQKLLQTSVNKILDQKRKVAFKKAKGKWQGSEYYSEVKETYAKSFKELIKFIEKSGIKVLRINNESDFNFKFILSETIPLEEYQKLKVVQTTDLELIGEKILKGLAYGKFVCHEQRRFIIINRLASKATLVHEYLHFLQAQKFNEYCGVDYKQYLIKSEFDKGKIGLDEYERNILYLQAINDLAEYDIYSQMNKIIDLFEKYERLNISENFKRYSLKLESYQD